MDEDIALLNRPTVGGVRALGVACAGPMLAGGVSVSPLNIPVWRDFALRAQLETFERVARTGLSRLKSATEGAAR